MSRWLPFPLISLALLALWLLLNQTLALAHILLGGVLGIVGGLTLTKLDLPRTNAKRAMTALILAGRVFYDIVRSNISVARIILFPRSRRAVSAFVHIPLKMRSPYGLALLGGIITAAPGTVWVDYDSETGVLVTHVLDLVDEQEWVNIIKLRYERALMEIFE